MPDPAPGQMLPDARGEIVVRCANDVDGTHSLRFSVGQTPDAFAAQIRSMGWRQDGTGRWWCERCGGEDRK